MKLSMYKMTYTIPELKDSGGNRLEPRENIILLRTTKL